MTAVALSDQVWLVGSSDSESAAFTSEYDCNQYLVWDGECGFLIDAGTGLGGEAWLANVRSVAQLDALTGVLITHYHGDHAGGTAYATSRGLRAFSGDLTAAALRDADETITQLARARTVGIYPADYKLQATASVQPIGDFRRIQIGSIGVTPISAPGHCDGHLVFQAEIGKATCLFSGDVIFAGGTVSIQAIPDCRLDAYADTVIGLAELRIDRLFPGHGVPVLHGASTQITAAADTFARLVPPPNFVS